MSETAFCHLCGLPLGGTVVKLVLDKDKSFSFCCWGCQQVFSMLVSSAGSQDVATLRKNPLYQKCQEMGLIPATIEDLKRREGETESVAREPSPAGLDPLENSQTLPLKLRIDGMWCPACAWVVSESLSKMPGVSMARCDFSTDRFFCRYNPVTTTPGAITETIEKLGYQSLKPGASPEDKTRKKALVRLGVCAFLTANIMMLSFALYSGFFMALSPSAILKLGWPMAVLAAVVVAYGGWPLYRRALWGLRSAAFGLETLITIGSLSAFFFSTYHLIGGSIHLYYDTTAMLITLVLIGKSLEQSAKFKIQKDLDSFFALETKKINIVNDAYPNGRYVHIEQVKKGDLFLVGPKEVVPADGRVVKGTGTVDEAALTGESQPREKSVGQRLISGTRVINGHLQVVVEAVGKSATLGRMVDIMEKTLARKTPFEGRAERLLQWFVPFVAGLALLTFGVCLYTGLGLEAAFMRAITVLVIACPCALGVAIPLTRVAAVALAGRHGMVVRDFAAFEKATRIDTVVFDKTGTLTNGNWQLLLIKPADGFSVEQVLSLAAGLEITCDHFIADEIRRYAQKQKISPAAVTDHAPQPNGIQGVWQKQKVKIGSQRFLANELNGAGVADWLGTPNSDMPRSRVYLTVNGNIAAVFVFGDQIKTNAIAAISALKRKNIQVAMISGDGQAATRTTAKILGIDQAHGGMLPAEKAAFVKKLQNKGGQVAMVGDGVNDAPALVQADLAVAMRSGADLGKEAATVTFMQAKPVQMTRFLDLSRAVNRKVIQNLSFSLLYNLIGIPLAMSGLLNPIMAVTAMLLSSLSVIGNTLMLLRGKAGS
jgi:heavy metal translocating P-type ATPase